MHRWGKIAGIWKKADMIISYCNECPFSRRHLAEIEKG
jgi:hypothetical protein